MSFPRYPKYKPSGVEWLGDVPEHWQSYQLKRAFRSIDYGISDALEPEGKIAVLRMGNIENGKVTTDDLKYTEAIDPGLILEKGDLLYNRTNSLNLIGKVGMFEGGEGRTVSYASYLVRLRTREECLSAYFAYLLNTEGILGLARASAFVSIGQCNLNPTRYGQIIVSVPPVVEQTAIANFLDRETGKIDGLISEQQRLIELLKEKRQASISHAVTKGLNLHAKMKPSGIEWLGDVPDHWDVVGLTKYLYPVVDYRGRTPTKVDEGVFLLTARNIRNGTIDYETSQEFIDPMEYEAVMSRGKPNLGDVVFTTEAPLGQVANLDRDDIAIAQRVIKFCGHPDKINNQFLKYWIMGSHCQGNLEQLATGSTALGIKGSKVGEVRLCLPPLSEQVNIVEFINVKAVEFESLVAEAERAIALLQERRTALISAAVTGQIDVRGLAG